MGIASELWDPSFIQGWRSQNASKVIVKYKGGRAAIWKRNDRPLDGPYSELSEAEGGRPNK